MSIFVLDCSVTLSWCFEEECNDHAKKILNMFNHGAAIVPGIWLLEVMNVLTVAERKNRLTSIQSDNFLGLLKALPIEVDAGLDNGFNKQIISLSRKYTMSTYDASYLDLAQRHQAPLASFDKELCSIAQQEGIKIL